MTEIVLYRMALPDHVCPFGVRAKELLEDEALDFEDRVLAAREEVEAFKSEHCVPTTPQLFVDGVRIGGSREIEQWLAEQRAAA
jgi:glutaredoxin